MALICASAPAIKGFFAGISKTVTNRYGPRTHNTDRFTSYPLASKNSTPRSGDGTADLIERDGQFITLHETLRGDEYSHRKTQSWDWRSAETKGPGVHAKYIEEPFYRGNWADSDLRSTSDATWNGIHESKSSDEILTSPGRRAMVQDGGILITETFSVERVTDPYAKERRLLGL